MWPFILNLYNKIRWAFSDVIKKLVGYFCIVLLLLLDFDISGSQTCLFSEGKKYHHLINYHKNLSFSVWEDTNPSCIINSEQESETGWRDL